VQRRVVRRLEDPRDPEQIQRLQRHGVDRRQQRRGGESRNPVDAVLPQRQV